MPFLEFCSNLGLLQMDGKYGGRACVAYASNLAPFKRFCIENYTVLYKIYSVVHRKVKERKGKMGGDWERGYKFSLPPFFSPSLSPVWNCYKGDLLVVFCRQHEEEKRVKKWKKPPLSFSIFYSTVHFTQPFYFICLLDETKMTVLCLFASY